MFVLAFSVYFAQHLRTKSFTIVLPRADSVGKSFLEAMESIDTCLEKARNAATEDVVQDILRAIATSFVNFRGQTAKEFYSFCYQIARRKIANHYQKRTRDLTIPFSLDEIQALAGNALGDHPSLCCSDKLTGFCSGKKVSFRNIDFKRGRLCGEGTDLIKREAGRSFQSAAATYFLHHLKDGTSPEINAAVSKLSNEDRIQIAEGLRHWDQDSPGVVELFRE